VPTLTAALRLTTEHRARLAALEGLRSLGARAKPATAYVRRLCRDRSAIISLKASGLCFALGDTGPAEVDRLVALALNADERPVWRIEALRLLAGTGKAVRGARLSLLELVDGSYRVPDQVREVARQVLAVPSP
jgi:hypothetical protein